jgi:hypothetical protein
MQAKTARSENFCAVTAERSSQKAGERQLYGVRQESPN